MDTIFCIDALEDALARFGRPDIFNTDQGSQFTSSSFTGKLLAAGIRISMDGRGRWLDNVFIERLSRDTEFDIKTLQEQAVSSQKLGSHLVEYSLSNSHVIRVMQDGTAVNFILPSLP